jgi:L-histidine N-alpha-methyltransferase
MSSASRVTIHRSQFPDSVRSALLNSLRRRQVNHKFHYDSIKQAQKWLALHAAYSPSRTDPDCAATYDRSFEAVAARIEVERIHLIGLGCGGGQKDVRLLELLRNSGKHLLYTPSDVSVALVLIAQQAALKHIPQADCFPLVCDLATADDLPDLLEHQNDPNTTRLCTFFGMIPNFEPETILPRLAALIRPSDWLLLSANLAPGPDYLGGVEKVLPLYDNELTRDWLLTFLVDLGVEKADGEVVIHVEDDSAGVKKIVADFRFSNSRIISVGEERFEFARGDAIRLFFSYRHTPELVRSLLTPYGLQVVDQWITRSQEEGIFLCRRS